MPNADFVTICCRRLYEKWSALRVGTDVPSLQSFLTEPDVLLQPNVALLDVVDATTLRVRLFATRLTDLAGFDLTGGNLLQFAKSQTMAQQIRHAADIVVGRPCGLRSTKRAVTTSGQHVDIEMLSLPLRPFAQGAPAIVAAVDIIERLERRDTVFGFLQYLSADWIDLGHGVPEAKLLPT